MKNWLAALALLLLIAPVWADRAPPPKKDDGAVPLVIQVDPRAQHAKLEIPKELLAKLRADAGGEPRGFAQVQTIVAGLSLALALAFGGVWLMRQPAGGKPLALLIGAGTALAIGGAALVWADVAPRPAPPMPVNGKVVLEVVEKGNDIKLVITREQAASLNGGLPRPVPRPLPAPAPGVGRGEAPAILPVLPPQAAPQK